MSKEFQVQQIILPEQRPFTLVDATDVLGVTVDKEVGPRGDIFSDGVQSPPLLFKDMFKNQRGEVFWSYPSRSGGWSIAAQSVGHIASHELALKSGLWGETAEVIASQPLNVAARLILQVWDLYRAPNEPSCIKNELSSIDINTHKPYDPLELIFDRNKLSLSNSALQESVIENPFEEKRRDEDPFAKY